MPVSATRLAQLRAEMEPTKKKIDDIDRKYGLDYYEPLVDMPESLDLERLTFTPKSEEELRAIANQQVQPAYLEQVRRLDASWSADQIRVEQTLRAIEQSALKEQAKLLANYNVSVEKLQQRLKDQGMIFSSLITRCAEKYRKQYDEDVNNSNQNADAEREAAEAKLESLRQKYDESMQGIEQERSVKAQNAYVKLAAAQENEQRRVDKYNTLLDEKEQKYLYTRAKAMEQARQAEYDRAYAARKLYQQMGATGYEEAKIWEKYNVLVNHLSTFTKREEALLLIQSDNYVRSHLQQYYSTLIEWINRNVPV